MSRLYEQLLNDGFCIIEDVIPVEILDEILNEVSTLADKVGKQIGIDVENIDDKLNVLIPMIYKKDPSAGSYIYHVMNKRTSFLSLYTANDDLQDKIAESLGCIKNELIISDEMFMINTPENKYVLGWHQESEIGRAHV